MYDLRFLTDDEHRRLYFPAIPPPPWIRQPVCSNILPTEPLPLLFAHNNTLTLPQPVAETCYMGALTAAVLRLLAPHPWIYLRDTIAFFCLAQTIIQLHGRFHSVWFWLLHVLDYVLLFFYYPFIFSFAVLPLC